MNYLPNEVNPPRTNLAAVDYLSLTGDRLEEALQLPSLESFDMDTAGNLDYVGRNDEIFQKIITLKTLREPYELPSKSTFFSTDMWMVEPMQLVKTELNGVKSLLNDFNVDEWHAHTRNLNPLSNVINDVRQFMDQSHEFCSIAWCKLYEMLTCHAVIPNVLQEAAKQLDEIQLHSVHLCEAPGAFVSALNHFLKTNYNSVKWDWIASTLNPHYEGNDKSTTLNQDQIILSSLDHWVFLEDNTGDIMNLQNLKSLSEDARKLGYVQLVTADGSIDCADTPDEQESTTSDLHYCEIMAALSILGKGGSFILKMFTFFECNSIAKLYLLSCYFQEVQIVKPAMSREGNSEVYILCKNFVGPSVFEEERNALMEYAGKIPENKSLFPLETIPRGFLNKVIDCSLFFATQQANSILRNIKVFPFGQGFYSLLRVSKAILAKRWFTMTGLSPLSPEHFIFNLEKTRTQFCFDHADPRVYGGSYNERMTRKHEQDTPTWINIISQEFDALSKSHEISPITSDLPCVSQYELKFGKPFNFIKGSRFCNNKFLEVNQALTKFISYCFKSLHFDAKLKQVLVHHCTHFQHSNNNTEDVEESPMRREPVQIACYNENCNRYEELNCSDSLMTRRFLERLPSTLEKLQPGEHLVLCKYPLLSRLQFGLAIVLANYFESGKICKELSEDFQGIIFYNFLGLQKNEQLWTDLKRIFLNKENLLETLMEIVPVTLLCQKRLCQDAITYNQQLLLINMREKIQATRQFFNLIDDEVTGQVESLDLDGT